MENQVETKVCPNCKKEVAVPNFDVHTAFCKRHLVLCTRCNEHVSVTDTDHMKEKHCRVSCDDCGVNMERWELDGPHKESCIKRAETCKYCEVTLSFDLLQDHLNYCGSRTEPCPMCKKFVVIKEKENHMKKECTKRLVFCRYCEFEYPFDEHREHIKYCVANSEPHHQEIEIGKAKGSHPKKPQSNKIPYSQGDAVPHDNLQERVLSCYKCIICEAAVPSDEFRAHYEKCVENARRFNTFPSHKTDESYECRSSSFVKIKEPVEDFTNSDEENQATQLKQSSDQLQTAKDSNSADKKSDVDSMHCMFCGYPCATHELEEHLKQCLHENSVLCDCGENVLKEKLYDHEKNCPQRVKFSKLWVTCVLCGKDLPRHELESHPCTRDNRRNGIKSKTQRLQQISDPMVNQPETKDKKMECCPFCERHFPVTLFKEHTQRCFMSPIECKHCGKSFSVDEFRNHLCSMFSNRNRTEGQKSHPTDDKASVNVLENKEQFSEPSEHHQQNAEVVQNTKLSFKNKYRTEDNTAEYLGNQNCGAEGGKLYPHAGGHVQMSTCVGIQNQNSLFGKNIEFCRFCTFPFDAEELEEHLTQCNSKYVPCGTCGVNVKSKELENHKKLCTEKEKQCRFCKSFFPPREIEQHFWSCPMSPVTCDHCEKVFPYTKFEGHFCSADVKRQNRKKGSGQNLKDRNNIEHEKCSTYFQQGEQKAETDESSDQSMEVDEDNAESQIPHKGSVPVEASRTRELTSYSSDEGLADDLQFIEGVFACKICNRRKLFKELSMSVFKDSETSVCRTCVENLKQLRLLDFTGNTYTGASCPPNEDISQSTAAVEKKEGPKQEVKLCEFCEFHLPLDAWAEHTRICKSRPYECLKCESYMLLSDREMHDRVCNGVKLDENCSGAQGGSSVNNPGNEVANSRCQYCQEVPNGSVKAHEKVCGMRFRKCKKCNTTVQLVNMKNPCENGHRSEQGSSRPPDVSQCAGTDKKNGSEVVVPCEFCDSYLPRNIWDSHIKTCEQSPYECWKCGSLIILGDKEAHDKICNGENLDDGSSGGSKGRSHMNNAGKKQGASGVQVEKKACQYCDIIPTCPLKAHEKDCGIRFRTCEKCNLQVQLRYMKIPCEYDHDMEKAEFAMHPGYAQKVIAHSTEEKENSVNEKIQAGGNSRKNKKNKKKNKATTSSESVTGSNPVCDDCGRPFSQSHIADHKKTCEMRLETCLFCNSSIFHCQKKEHIESYCPGSPPSHEIGRGQPKKQEGKKGMFSTVAGYLGVGTSRSEHSPQRRNAKNQQVHHYGYHPTHHESNRQPEPVKIPCEFCNMMCFEHQLIVHQSGCRPDLFAGSSEGDTAPHNRRRNSDDDNRLPDNRPWRNDNSQRNASLGQDHRNIEEDVSRNKNIFKNHPLGNDEELNDVRYSRQNLRSYGDIDVNEINMTARMRNLSIENTSKKGAEKLKNNCNECWHLNRPEVSPNDQLGTRPRSGTRNDDNFNETKERNVCDRQTKVEVTHDRVNSEDGDYPPPSNSCGPPEIVDDTVSFSYVAKADKRNPNSGNLKQPSDSERGQQRYQTNRLHQETESVSDCQRYINQQSGLHSKGQKTSVECKIFYKDKTVSELDNNLDMSLNREMNRNCGESQAKKNFRDDKANNAKSLDDENGKWEISDQHQSLMARQSDENYLKPDVINSRSKADNTEESFQQNTEGSLYQYYDEYNDSMVSKHRSKENEYRPNIMPNQRGWQGNRRNENSSAASGNIMPNQRGWQGNRRNENSSAASGNVTPNQQGWQGYRNNENSNAASGKNSWNSDDGGQRRSARHANHGGNRGQESRHNPNVKENRIANRTNYGRSQQHNSEKRPEWK